jgi:hypothetical protein
MEDKLGRPCRAHKGYKIPTKCWFEGLKARDHFEDLGLGEKIILK